MIEKKFKSGDRVRCRRAMVYQVRDDAFVTGGPLVSIPVARVVREITDSQDDSQEFISETGGLYLVETLSLPIYEVAEHSADTVEFKTVPNRDAKVGNLICLAGEDLFKIVLN